MSRRRRKRRDIEVSERVSNPVTVNTASVRTCKKF